MCEEKPVKFAKIVFWIASIWGLLVITPLYFMFDLIGRQDPPPITHPGFFYGFVGAALAWQIAFVLIARDPVRHRPLMIPSVIEKFTYWIAVLVLVERGRMHASDMLFGVVDLLLGVLFVIAYIKTPADTSVLR
jgi:vacuolar-type H+-ATPase subunit I/STV1